MKKIALVNLFGGHTEVFGYLIEIFKKKNYEITYIYKNELSKDRFKYIQYFESLYGNIEKKTINEFSNIYNDFNKIIFITMTADVPGYIQNVKEKTYGIVHVFHRKSPYICNYISLFPNQRIEFNKKIKNKNFNYTFPFYNTPKIIDKDFKYILYIGSILDNDDDIKYFQKNIKYKLIFFNNKNRSIKSDMFNMVDYFKNTLFILGKKTYNYPYLYSGSITLSFSFNIPIILPEFKKEEYNIPCISFKEKYSELIDYINNINNDDYNNLLKNMENFKDNEINKNLDFFNKF